MAADNGGGFINDSGSLRLQAFIERLVMVCGIILNISRHRLFEHTAIGRRLIGSVRCDQIVERLFIVRAGKLSQAIWVHRSFDEDFLR